jgi:hypothetical protein
MHAIVAAVIIGVVLLVIAVVVEIRERRGVPGDGNYRSTGHPHS